MSITPLPTYSREAATARLIELGWAVDERVPGYHFGDTLRRFQSASLDRQGKPLAVDGQYGPMAADALFNVYPLPGQTLNSRMVTIARSQIGVAEVPPGSNQSPQINRVLQDEGLGPGYPWCSAFADWCVAQACRQLGLSNSFPHSAGVLLMWELAGHPQSGLTRITPTQARRDPGLIKPGMHFFLQLSPTAGHRGLIEKVNAGGVLQTIEGNGNQQGGRDGEGVVELTRRTINSISLGFVGYAS